MEDIERRIYFYKVEMTNDAQVWRRADVLRGLEALEANDRVIDLGQDQYAWAVVDHVPRTREGGRLRLFRDRRSNLPGFAHDFNPSELPIPDEAGLIEPTHVVLAGDGLIAAEYNHYAPRIPTHFAALLRSRLGLGVRIGTYVQGSIIEQLDRLSYVHLLECSLVPTRELEDELRNAGPFADAAIALSRADGGRRLNFRLSAERHEAGWTDQARQFVKRVMSLGGNQNGHTAKVLRVTGHDPLTGSDEIVDLLKQKLVRLVDLPKVSARSKVLDKSSAYEHIDEAIREVRETDLRTAAVLWS